MFNKYYKNNVKATIITSSFLSRKKIFLQSPIVISPDKKIK